jgi:hypothetical protein
MMNGRIDKPGDVDCWRFTAKKGEVFEIDLRAARLGSPLLGLLVLTDESGKELARSDGGGPAGDPQLRFAAPADGTFAIRVNDQFRSRGGPDFAYRLRLAPPPAPDFRLTLATDVFALPRGTQGKLRVQAERLGGFAEPIAVTVAAAPIAATTASSARATQVPSKSVSPTARRAISRASRDRPSPSPPASASLIMRCSCHPGWRPAEHHELA